MSSRKRWIVIGIAVLLAAAAAWLFLRSRTRPARFVAVTVDRGDVAEVVGSTGALQAVQTVQVGSQVSGTISELAADFNSKVTKDQVIARLDPSLFQARLGQAQANLVAARANADKARTALEDARLKRDRAQTLFEQQLLPQTDLETARATYDSAVSGVKAADAAVTQSAASVNQAQVDLQHTIIRAPITGIVIGRSVDVGQTVAASLQAPVLFVIANDLARMQVLASVDEADVGRVREGAEVTFRVDAFPDRTFRGRVEQVRLQPTVVQNVVTYNAIISVDNPGQILMPGMTATVSVVSEKRESVVRVPAAALRFRPEGFAAPGGAGGPRVPGAGGGRQGGRGGGPRSGGGGNGGGAAGAGASGAAGSAGAPAPGAPAPGAPASQGAPTAGGPTAGGPTAGGASGAAASEPPEERTTADDRGAGGRSGLVFVMGPDGKPQPRRIRLGLSDGQYTEVVSGLQEGEAVITGTTDTAVRAGAPRPSGSPSSNPFNPQFQRRQR
jgi:HlyD family secretion protein